jgi:hypothetical protein
MDNVQNRDNYILIPMAMKVTVVSDVSPCSLVNIYVHQGGAYF